MTHVVRTRLRNFCLAVLPAGIVFSFLLISPTVGLSQTPSFSTHSFTYATYNVPGLHADLNNDGYVTGTIASTQLWVDGVKKYSTASKSLSTSISLAAGTHRFAVIATSTSGQKWESAINATVQ